MGKDFVLLTYGASFDVVCDPFLHSQPVVEFLGFSECFVSAGVSGGHVIMYLGHDSSQEVV